MTTKSARDDLIDVVRGLAILCVVAVHVAQQIKNIDNEFKFFFQLASFGRYGVELFYVISGYLMFKIYGWE